MYEASLGHRINAVAPIDLNGGVTSDAWSMKDHRLAEIIIQIGVSAGAVPTVTVEECTSAAGAGNTAIAFKYQACTTAVGSAGCDTFGDVTACASTGLALSTTNNIFYRLFVAADALTDGSHWLRVVFSNPSASVIGSVLVNLHEPRFAKAIESTVTA